MADQPNRSKLLQMFREMATEVAEREVDASEESIIADLGLDSLQTLEVIGQMEQSLSIQVPDDELVGIERIAQLLDLVEKRMGAS